VLADIDRGALDAMRRELLPINPRIATRVTDVMQRDSVAHLLERSVEQFGRVDVLVNCAGVIYPGDLEDASEATIRQQIDVNLLGTIHTTQAFLAQFRRPRSRHLIHVASLGGIVPLPGEAVYSATKFAVRGFCLSLAIELRDSPVRVSVIHPDSTDTAQLRAEALHGGYPLSFTSAPLEAEDVARAIVKTIERPKLEVAVPSSHAWPVRIAGLAPSLLRLLYPALSRRGGRRRERYLRALERRATWPPSAPSHSAYY
jgi:short-subunit dehydrogenase